MSSNNRYENQRGRREDRDYDYSGQQGGNRSGQMGQFEDGGRRSQGEWSTGEDYQSAEATLVQQAVPAGDSALDQLVRLWPDLHPHARRAVVLYASDLLAEAALRG